MPEELPGPIKWDFDSKVLRKLIGTFEKYMDGAIPALAVRRSKARAEAERHLALTRAQTQQDAKRISDGTHTYDDGKLIPIEKPQGKPPLALVTLEQAAALSDRVQSMERFLALHDALGYAAEEAAEHPEGDKTSEAEVEPDWFARWRASAQDARSEELKRLWGRILAGEVREPGSYSLRLLQFVSLLSRSDAECIQRVAPFIVNGMVLREPNKDAPYPKPTFVDLLHMEELTILTGCDGFGLQRKFKIEADTYADIRAGNLVLRVWNKEDAERILALPIAALTNLGKQVMSLGSFEPNEEHIRGVGRFIVSNNFKVELLHLGQKSKDGWLILKEEEIQVSP